MRPCSPVSILLTSPSSLTQSWDNAPLHLETATPSFGVNLPTLLPWMIHPPRASGGWGSLSSSSTSALPIQRQAINLAGGSDETALRSLKRMSMSVAERGERLDSLGSISKPLMAHAGSDVQSRGNVSTTFKVPGVVTIPSDGEKHTFTIVQLNFEAEMSWVVIPKKDLRVHLKVG
jgi:hypothetical protein